MSGNDTDLVRGSCFGFEIRSPLAFRYLRGGGGEPLTVLEVDGTRSPGGKPIKEWARFGGLPIEARLEHEDDMYSLWVQGMGWYQIDPTARSIGVPFGVDSLSREERLWGIPAALCYLARGDLPIHASAVDIGGSAILFAAPGHFGKTTLAAAFLRAGHRVLAEDTACCHPSDAPFVWPGPAMLRVRRDVYERFDCQGTALLADEPERLHLAVQGGLRGDSQPVPIAGVVFLRPSDGRCYLERVDPHAAVPDLFSLTFKLPLDDSLARSFEGVAQLSSAVPVWNLYRPLRFDTLSDVVERVLSTVGQN